MTSAQLTADERAALGVLAFLFFRMGRTDSARRAYKALSLLAPEGSAEQHMAQAGLAAAALEAGDAKTALACAERALAGGALPSRASALHLLRAQALWREGRADEARAALETYMQSADRTQNLRLQESRP